MNNRVRAQHFMLSALRQWWFLGLLLLPELLPPYSSHGYALHEWSTVNAFIITHPVKWISSGLFPIFQVIPLGLLIAVFAVRQKVSRLFNIYVAISYVLVAFLQSISISQTWGTAVCTGNLITFLILAGLWFHEAVHPQNRLDLHRDSVWKYWPLVLALFAFWEPIDPRTLTPDFNPVYLFTSGSGLSFCLVTPLYLAILILSFPHVNKPLFACTGFIGLFMGISNLVLEFIIIPAYWWIGILHFPLVILSMYCLWITIVRSPEPQ
jgi:hypothetical protein